MKTQIIQPTYTCKLPSSGETVKFRPFTVKEEKALLLALEENSIDTVSEILKSTVTECSFGKIDVDSIPYYDIEYLFLQIRAKSVGEIIELVGSCDCSPTAKTYVDVDINTMKLEPAPSGNLVIKVVDTNYTLEMRHPSLSNYVEAYTKSSTGTDVVAKCIVAVYTDEEVFDWSYKEKLEFVESMSPKQQKDITKFLDNMPIVKLDASYKCSKCGKLHSNVMSGFENFFV